MSLRALLRAGLQGRRILCMGVINATPDSFHADSRTHDVAAALARGLEQEASGADVIDVGGESTRPGSTPLSAREELERVLPVIEALAGRVSIPLSIDTYKAEVARAAVGAGATLVNDVGGGLLDRDMPAAIAELRVPVIVGHIRGTPETMQRAPHYENAVEEVHAELAAQLAAFRAAGVPPDDLLVDPGIGFGKRVEDNLALIAGLARIADLGPPVVVGVSRKGFLGELQARAGLERGGPGDRLEASLAAAVLAAERGAKMIRTHDVAATRRALSVLEALADRS